jgi:hypothetical protein
MRIRQIAISAAYATGLAVLPIPAAQAQYYPATGSGAGNAPARNLDLRQNPYRPVIPFGLSVLAIGAPVPTGDRAVMAWIGWGVGTAGLSPVTRSPGTSGLTKSRPQGWYRTLQEHRRHGMLPLYAARIEDLERAIWSRSIAPPATTSRC